MVFVLILIFSFACASFALSLDPVVGTAFEMEDLPSTDAVSVTSLTSGNLVVCAKYDNSYPGSSHVFPKNTVRSFAANGTVLWTNQDSTDAELIGSISDSQDNTYTVGMCRTSWHGGAWHHKGGVCLVKYNAAGNVTLKIRDDSSEFISPFSVAVDNDNGALYVVGITNSLLWKGAGKIGSMDSFFLQYSNSGTLLELKRYGTPGCHLQLQSVAVDGAGNVWAVGDTNAVIYEGHTSFGETDILVQKTNPSGAMLFAALIGGSGHDSCTAVALDEHGNAYVVGGTVSAVDGITLAGGSDIVVAKFSNEGTKLWSKLFGGAGVDHANDVAVDDVSGHVYITGFTTSAVFHGAKNPTTSYSAFLIIISPHDGAVVDARVSAGSGSSTGTSVFARGKKVYAAGSAAGNSCNHATESTPCAYALEVEGTANKEYSSSLEYMHGELRL